VAGSPAPRRAFDWGCLARLALPVLAALALVWALAYFVLGVTPAFVVGLIRARLAPPYTAAAVSAPPGVTVTVFAADLGSPTSLAWGPDGRLYAATLTGQVIALAEADGDGQVSTAERQVFATGLSSPLGLAFDPAGALYVSQRGGVTRLRDTDGDGAADEQTEIITGLPALRHQTDGLAFGPDGRLYISQGSTSDRGETGFVDREASILVAEPDGSGLRVFASGTRNPYDLAFYPGTDRLFATDNGRDVPASGVPDELNLIVDGGDYGWPDCWGTNQGSQCAGTLPPVAELPAHAAAGGLVFYSGALFPEWQGDAFITLYGANSGDPRIGRRVLRVALTQTGDTWTGTVSDFATGFDRPLDITQGPDGALYVADFGAGVIYRLGQ
jgi:glucose/arabinose dehydrogenase